MSVNNWYKERGGEAKDTAHQPVHRTANESTEEETGEKCAERKSKKRYSLGGQLEKSSSNDSLNGDASSKGNGHGRRPVDSPPECADASKTVQFAQQVCYKETRPREGDDSDKSFGSTDDGEKDILWANSVAMDGSDARRGSRRSFAMQEYKNQRS